MDWPHSTVTFDVKLEGCPMTQKNRWLEWVIHHSAENSVPLPWEKTESRKAEAKKD